MFREKNSMFVYPKSLQIGHIHHLPIMWTRFGSLKTPTRRDLQGQRFGASLLPLFGKMWWKNCQTYDQRTNLAGICWKQTNQFGLFVGHCSSWRKCTRSFESATQQHQYHMGLKSSISLRDHLQISTVCLDHHYRISMFKALAAWIMKCLFDSWRAPYDNFLQSSYNWFGFHPLSVYIYI